MASARITKYASLPMSESQPWRVGKVSVLYDEAGKTALGFYLDGPSTERSEIPVEIFSHQIAELSLDDPEKIAEFMSEYGMIFDSSPYALDEMDRYCHCVDSCYAFDYNEKAITPWLKRGTELKYGCSWGRSMTRLLWREEVARLNEYWKLQPTFAQMAERAMHPECFDEPSVESAPNPKVLLVSIQEVIECVELIRDLAILAKAFHYEDPVPRLASIGTGEELRFRIVQLDRALNNLLAAFHPRMETCIVDENHQPISLLDADEVDYTFIEYSLMNAIGVELWEFSNDASLVRLCRECGQPFIRKQSKSKTSRSNLKSDFCCDKCKNRNSQREHRKTSGYRQQQEKRRAKKSNRD